MSNTNDQLIAELRIILTSQRYSPIVIGNYCAYARGFLSYLALRNMPVANVTQAQVEKYLRHAIRSFHKRHGRPPASHWHAIPRSGIHALLLVTHRDRRFGSELFASEKQSDFLRPKIVRKWRGCSVRIRDDGDVDEIVCSCSGRRDFVADFWRSGCAYVDWRAGPRWPGPAGAGDMCVPNPGRLLRPTPQGAQTQEALALLPALPPPLPAHLSDLRAAILRALQSSAAVYTDRSQLSTVL
jgi:hypothetical protein